MKKKKKVCACAKGKRKEGRSLKERKKKGRFAGEKRRQGFFASSKQKTYGKKRHKKNHRTITKRLIKKKDSG